jgi:DNA-binding response OmpR family regulator
MSKILIVEGLCPWNGYVKKRLIEEKYDVRTASSLKSIWPQIEKYQPDLILINLGRNPALGWQLFRQLKSYDSRQALLSYHVVNPEEVEEVVRAVNQALREVKIKNFGRRITKTHWNTPLKVAI